MDRFTFSIPMEEVMSVQIRNQRGYTVLFALLVVSVVIGTYIMSTLNTVKSASETRATIRQSVTSDLLFETLAQTVYSAYQVAKQNGGTCPSGMATQAFTRGATTFNLCFSNNNQQCVTNPVNPNVTICPTNRGSTIQNGEQGNGLQLSYNLRFNETPYVAWLTDQAEKFWNNPDVSLIPEAHAQTSHDVYLPREPAGRQDDPPDSGLLLPFSTVCTNPATSEMHCITLRICLTRANCTDDDALYQRIGFAR